MAKRERPDKPNGSPIFPHASGSWAAKINGKLRYFGGWGDYKGALERYREFSQALRAGSQPRPLPGAPLRLERLVDRYLTFQFNRATATKDIGLRSFKDMKQVADAFADFIGDDREIHTLAPTDFEAFRRKLAETQGPDALKRSITLTKQMFKWAVSQELIPHLPNYGLGFETPKKVLMRKAEREHIALHGRKFFSPAEVRRLIDAAGVQLKGMIFLGINCGMANTDCATLPKSVIDFVAGVIDYSREKTGLPRRCFLWPETIHALQAAIDFRPKAADKEDDRLVFLTAFGVPWVRTGIDSSAELPVTNDAITQEFGKLQDVLGMRKRGRGFQSLRRTHRTFSGQCKDKPAADLIMGHGTEDMGSRYVQEIEDHRLRSISDHIRGLIFGAPEKESRHRPAAKPTSAHVQAPRRSSGKRVGGKR